MNPEAQRVAIAEACGFVPSIEEKIPHRPIWTHPKSKDCYWKAEDLPDYLSDLNAMNEAEKTLTEFQKLDYHYALIRVCDIGHRAMTLNTTWNATAAQRAEAFLLTLGRWKDETPCQ